MSFLKERVLQKANEVSAKKRARQELLSQSGISEVFEEIVKIANDEVHSTDEEAVTIRASLNEIGEKAWSICLARIRQTHGLNPDRNAFLLPKFTYLAEEDQHQIMQIVQIDEWHDYVRYQGTYVQQGDGFFREDQPNRKGNWYKVEEMPIPIITAVLADSLSGVIHLNRTDQKWEYPVLIDPKSTEITQERILDAINNLYLNRKPNPKHW